MYVLIEVTREKVVRIFHNENDLEIYLEVNKIKTQGFNRVVAIKDCSWRVINTCELIIDNRIRYSVICTPTV